jgi:undecaprenyl-diphosphatase
LTAAALPDRLRERIRDERSRRRLITLAIALGLAVVALRAWVSLVSPLPGDETTGRRLPSQEVPTPLNELAQFFATVATPLVALATVAAAVWLVQAAWGRRRATGVAIAAGAVVVNSALKVLWGPTPLQAELHPGAGGNYPSGHVTYATALFGYLAVLALERRQTRLAVVALALVLGMGPARIIDGSHVPSDVIGGYLLGAAWVIAVSLWTTRR